MRISTQQMWKSTLGNINGASVRQAAAGERISSGRRITKASDDPTGADRSAQLRANSSAIEQYERAGSDAVAFMNAQDRTLQTVLDRLNRVKELTIAMATGPLTSEAREVAAIEVEEVRTELV
jgi:flagellar hook-associated protein 3 FlgL